MKKNLVYQLFPKEKLGKNSVFTFTSMAFIIAIVQNRRFVV